MRKIVGWLCFLSFAVAILGLGYWAYATLAPFFRGAAVYHHDSPDPTDTIRSIATDGLRPSTGDALESYVDRSPRFSRFQKYSGWGILDVGQARALAISGEKDSGDWRLPIAVAAAAYDTHGDVVAAYPKKLKARLSRIPDYEVRHMFASVSQNGTPHWDGNLNQKWAASLSAAGIPRPTDIEVYAYPLALKDKAPVGLLVTANRDWWNRWTVYMPESAKVRGPISRWMSLWLAGISLLVWLVTLPIWVAMDAGWRGMRPFAWGALIVLTNVIGLAAYLIARLPPPRPCYNCGENVLVKYKRCPTCGVSLLERCPFCNTKMRAGWQHCPVCNGFSTQPPTVWVPAADTALPCPAVGASLIVEVSDADSAAPIPNARVVITGPASIDGLTNPTGRFEARKLPSGHYTVSTVMAGYEPASVEVGIGEDSPQTTAVRLEALPGSIGGKVLDRRSLAPVLGARVYLDSSRIDRSATTQGDGAFELENMPPGPYTVNVEADGYASQVRLVDVQPGRRTDIEIALDVESKAVVG